MCTPRAHERLAVIIHWSEIHICWQQMSWLLSFLLCRKTIWNKPFNSRGKRRVTRVTRVTLAVREGIRLKYLFQCTVTRCVTRAQLPSCTFFYGAYKINSAKQLGHGNSSLCSYSRIWYGERGMFSTEQPSYRFPSDLPRLRSIRWFFSGQNPGVTRSKTRSML